MKHVFFTLILFFSLVFAARCQINKGNWLIGGDVAMAQLAEKNAKADTLLSRQSNLYVTPRVGWFIKNNLVIGLSPTYSFRYYRYTGNGIFKDQTSTFSVSPFIRYYKPIKTKWAIFAEFDGINLNFSYNKVEDSRYSYDKKEVKSKGYQLGLFVRPGITYFISSKVGIEVSMGSIGYGFNHTKKKTTFDSDPHTIEIVENSARGTLQLNNFIQNLSMGIHIYLPGK